MPFDTSKLVDNFGRQITTLRLSITDQCDLSCRYCRPQGCASSPSADIMSWPELIRTVDIFSRLGITRIRITGGEPFNRKGLLPFLSKVRAFFPGGLYLTTNGVRIAPQLAELEKTGIDGINLSLDTLDRERFIHITGVDALDGVLNTMIGILDHRIPLKINTVIMNGINTDDILSISQLAHLFPVQVRFIEEMLFTAKDYNRQKIFTAREIEKVLRHVYNDMNPVPASSTTARMYRIRGFRGFVGIIAGHSRWFCTNCNRIRVTADGRVKTCLYAENGLSLKSLFRHGLSDAAIVTEIRRSLLSRPRNGFIAENQGSRRRTDNMSVIGG